MTFTEIFKTESSDEVKVSQLSALVSDIRNKYGNSDITIDEPLVNTDSGLMKLSYLSDEDKVALASRCVKEIITLAAEEVEETQGVLFDRVVESIVATSPVLCNIATSTGSAYL